MHTLAAQSSKNDDHSLYLAARYQCDGGWAVDVNVVAGQPGIAYAVSQTEAAPQAAYDSFVRGQWELQPFVTLHEHKVAVGTKVTNDDVQFGLVDMCRFTSPGQPASARLANFTDMCALRFPGTRSCCLH